MDPSDWLPAELMLLVFGFLERKDLASCMRVNKHWSSIAAREALWKVLCAREWSDKVYVPAHIRAVAEAGESREALRLSLEDAKRQYLTEEELCAFEWGFRFKSYAGFDWIAFDPWWNNKPAALRKFLPTGEMEVLNKQDLPYGHWEFRWRFTRTSGRLVGPIGAFVKVNNFPAYCVARFKNWGFTMESCWCVLTSFPMPALGECFELEDPNLRITYDLQESEAHAYNVLPQQDFGEGEGAAEDAPVSEWDSEEGSESESEEEGEESSDFTDAEGEEIHEITEGQHGVEMEDVQDPAACDTVVEPELEAGDSA